MRTYYIHRTLLLQLKLQKYIILSLHSPSQSPLASALDSCTFIFMYVCIHDPLHCILLLGEVSRQLPKEAEESELQRWLPRLRLWERQRLPNAVE